MNVFVIGAFIVLWSSNLSLIVFLCAVWPPKMAETVFNWLDLNQTDGVYHNNDSLTDMFTVNAPGFSFYD